MIISMPVNEHTIEKDIAESFGRAEYFLIYNTETKNEAFIENKASKSPGGAGIVAAQTIVDNRVDVLITPQCGQNAADVLKQGNVKLYKSIKNTAEENIKAFNDGRLELLNKIHPGFHGNEKE